MIEFFIDAKIKYVIYCFTVFLSEVIDSLTRGYREKSNPDFLILEINSSRYAYNMSLKEVNFNVVKAVFGMESIVEPTNNNVLVAIHAVFKQLGPVVSNYIKSEDAMLDCLKALEVSSSITEGNPSRDLTNSLWVSAGYLRGE